MKIADGDDRAEKVTDGIDRGRRWKIAVSANGIVIDDKEIDRTMAKHIYISLAVEKAIDDANEIANAAAIVLCPEMAIVHEMAIFRHEMATIFLDA